MHLRQNDLIKVLAEPTLTTVSGRPAAFNAGGEFPILIPQGLGYGRRRVQAIWNACGFRSFRYDQREHSIGSDDLKYRKSTTPEAWTSMDSAYLASEIDGLTRPLKCERARRLL